MSVSSASEVTCNASVMPRDHDLPSGAGATYASSTRFWTTLPRPSSLHDELLAPLGPAERDQFVQLFTRLLDHHARTS
ncbi:hypothetical protein AR457_02580 [Streptomyces agglomeratus]|uniref:Uncharacterized protein n=1 Tax=Streptomyces agglomeratus TaxID=285458 RepID=A0A1E5P213_9ACTN|nr:hypothetical protein [Streptomyces agglomeratus]OEJ23549.1 hypothetical protein AS594_02680 [Streptomyces agglomeratus]OEJ43144.1 hypothetical protein AR457_02580 [Streptomyces agglomeratus]OEJ54936.1 hypothetical protein BGK72_33195 [Streptomyces agglomeratus]